MFLDRLLQVVAPHSCVRCQTEGKIVCDSCLPKLAVVKQSTCFLCNKLTKSWRTCSSCRHKTKLRGVKVASHYEGAVKELIRSLKYRYAVEAAGVLAKLLMPLIEAEMFDLVTAAPSSSRRYRQRGYNHAQLIAKELARQSKLPYFDLLRRLGHSRQVGTNRAVRKQQVVNTMYVSRNFLANNKRILVVDDVVTTGATMSEAGRALKEAGAKYIWGTAVAKH